jgi:hypothetical protein
MPDEEWRDIAGYEGQYQVSNLGRVKSLDHATMHRGCPRRVWGKILKPVRCHGYLVVWLGRRQRRFVHRLVAEAFLEPIPEGQLVHHLDADRTNARASNLAILSPSENQNRSFATGTRPQPHGEDHGRAILTDEMVRIIRREYIRRNRTHGARALANRYGVSPTAIWMVIRGQTWRHLLSPVEIEGICYAEN